MEKIKKILTAVVIFTLVFSLTACSASKPEVKKEDSKISLTDQAGRKITLEKPAKKIVSGYYITTYACLSLQIDERIVGLEKKANTRPIYQMANPDLLNLPQVGTMKGLDIEAIAKLKPDLVLIPMKLKDTAQTLSDLGINTLVVNPESHELLVEMIELIAKAAGVEERAAKLTDYYQKQIKTMKKYHDENKQTVYLGSNSSYLETAPKAMYQNTLIETAGGINAGKDLQGNYWMPISYESLIEINPDVIIVPSGAVYSVEDILANQQLASINAIKNRAVYQMPKGIEEWDSPIPSGILGTMWLSSTLHSDKYSFTDFSKDAVSFYKTFYGFEIDKNLITK